MSCSVPHTGPPVPGAPRRVDGKIIIYDEKPIREETHQNTIVHETPPTALLALRGEEGGLAPLVTVCACASSKTQIDSGGPSISSEREASQAPGVVVRQADSAAPTRASLRLERPPSPAATPSLYEKK